MHPSLHFLSQPSGHLLYLVSLTLFTLQRTMLVVLLSSSSPSALVDQLRPRMPLVPEGLQVSSQVVCK